MEMISFSAADSFFSLIFLHHKDVQKKDQFWSATYIYISCIAWELFNG